MATLSPLIISIFHSSLSLSLRSRNATIPSGTVALNDGEPGRAAVVLLFKLMLSAVLSVYLLKVFKFIYLFTNTFI